MSTSPRTALVVAAGAAVAGVAAGCHPTGTPVVDPLETAAFAGLVTVVASRARREALLVLGAVGVIMSRGWVELPAAAALLAAFASVFVRHPRRPLRAVVGALGVESMLRWAPVAVHGTTALVAAATVAVVAATAYRRVPSADRRRARRAAAAVAGGAVVLCLPLAVAAALSVAKVTSGEHQAQQALGEVGQGTSGAAAAPLRSAGAAFATASSALGGWWTQASRLVPVVAQQRQALAGATAAAARLGTVAAGVAPSFAYSRLAYHQGQIDLAAVSAMGRPARVLDAALRRAAARVAAVGSPWLLPPVGTDLHRFAGDVGRARSSTAVGVQAIADVPAMLGADGPRHYFVAFMAPAESRGLGGIVGAYAELTAVDGQVTLTRAGSDGDLDSALPPGGGNLTGPPDFLAQYGQFDPGLFFQDVSYAPDLPTDAQVMAQLYPQAGGDPVDGVLVLDPAGLARLLAITGPVTVPGLPYPITQANAVPFLLRGLYQLDGGNDVLQNQVQTELIRTAFERLTDGSLPGPATLSRLLDPAVLGGHLGLWSADPADTGLLDDLHVADAFPAAHSGDLVAVTTENAGANKLDAYVHERVTDHIAVNPATGAVAARLTVTLHDDVPAAGLPPLVTDSGDAPGTPTGADPLLVSVYSPYGVDGVAIDGRPSTVTAGQGLGVHVYSQWVTVPAGGTTTLTLGLVGAATPGAPYVLHVRLGPAANPVAFRATVDGGGTTSTWTAGPDTVQRHRFPWP